jgi:hypothetical protein
MGPRGGRFQLVSCVRCSAEPDGESEVATLILVNTAGSVITRNVCNQRTRDPAFTMRVSTHLMPASGERARQAIERVLGGDSGAMTMEDGHASVDDLDGLETA